MTKSNKQRQQAYRDRQEEKGFILFRTWIPKQKLERLKQFVKELLSD